MATNDTVKATILTDGNVGIGTTAPASKLHIKDSTNPPEIRFEDANGGTQTAKIVYDQQGQNSLVISTQYDSSSNVIQFAPADNVAMTLKGNGNVGIGTVTPSEKLEVTGAIKVNQDANNYGLFIDSEATTYESISVRAKYGMYVSQDIGGGYGAYFDRNLNEAGSSPLVTINSDHTANTQPALKVNQDGAGYGIQLVQNGAYTGLLIDQNGNQRALYIDSESTNYQALDIRAKYGMYVLQDLAGGYGAYFDRNLNEAGSNAVVTIRSDHTANTQPSLTVQQDGTGHGIFLDQNGNGTALWIDSESTNRNTVESYGKYGYYHSCDVSGGYGLYITRNLNEAGTSNLASFIDDHTASTKTTVYIKQDGTGPALVAMGNVGIGTTAPSADLEVSTASGGEFLVTRSGNSGVTLQQVNGGDATSGSLSIKGGTSMNLFTGGVNRLVIDATGNVSLPADGASLKLGASADLQMWHGSDGHSYLSNTTGAFWIKSTVTDGNIIFAADRGDGGGTFDYFTLDGGSATYSGGTTAAYTKWQDNSRIALGTGKDLQLYHDGSHSYIKNAGTGNVIFNSDIVQFKSEGGGHTGLTVDTDGQVALYYNNALKLATASTGVDVTGYLKIADVDTGVGWGDLNTGVFGRGTANSGSYLQFRVNGGTAAIHIDSDKNVGIGTTAPLARLHVREANAGSFTYDGTADTLIVESNANGGITIATAAANTGRIIFASPNDPTGAEIKYSDATSLMTIGTTTPNDHLVLQAGNGVEAVRVQSDGNVGIGSASPAAPLDVARASDYKVTKIGDDVTSHYVMTGNSDHTLTLTSPSYFQAEIVITANQTNGGDYNNLYIRGIWSNNHTSHHWDEIENVGNLDTSTFTITVGQNGATTNSGEWKIVHDYVSGTFAGMTVRITDFYGTHAYTIS